MPHAGVNGSIEVSRGLLEVASCHLVSPKRSSSRTDTADHERRMRTTTTMTEKERPKKISCRYYVETGNTPRLSLVLLSKLLKGFDCSIWMSSLWVSVLGRLACDHTDKLGRSRRSRQVVPQAGTTRGVGEGDQILVLPTLRRDKKGAKQVLWLAQALTLRRIEMMRGPVSGAFFHSIFFMSSSICTSR
mmetsp:Transcript_34552/g.108305  ORF Transcript_34552/g.108305 Transcript_34552/m.108305 type:complete len:189 (-) Transcript_34552:701-1267(-)